MANFSYVVSSTSYHLALPCLGTIWKQLGLWHSLADYLDITAIPMLLYWTGWGFSVNLSQRDCDPQMSPHGLTYTLKSLWLWITPWHSRRILKELWPMDKLSAAVTCPEQFEQASGSSTSTQHTASPDLFIVWGNDLWINQRVVANEDVLDSMTPR